MTDLFEQFGIDPAATEEPAASESAPVDLFEAFGIDVGPTVGEQAGGLVLGGLKGAMRSVKWVPDLVQMVAPNPATQAASDFFQRGIEAADQLAPEAYRLQQGRPILYEDAQGETQAQLPGLGQAVGVITESLPQIPSMLVAGGGAARGLQGLGLARGAAQAAGYGAANSAMVTPLQRDEVLREALAEGQRHGLSGDGLKQYATERANALAQIVGPLSFATGAAGLGLAARFGEGSSNALAGFAKGVAGDAPFEAIEEGGQNIAADIAMRRPINTTGALNAGAMGALAGGVTGGALGAVSSGPAADATQTSRGTRGGHELGLLLEEEVAQAALADDVEVQARQSLDPSHAQLQLGAQTQGPDVSGNGLVLPGQSVVNEPASSLDLAAHAAATSPNNDLPEPSQAQKEAGNYKKGRVRVHGMDISIESPRGSERSGIGPDGTEWRHTMSDHYGYIKRTTGADGEQVDAYVGPQPNSDQVFVVDQLNQQDGSFDEHKVMLGYPDQASAIAAYRANFDEGWRVGPVTAMPADQFKAWLKEGDLSGPLAQDQPEAPEAPGAPAQGLALPGQASSSVPLPPITEVPQSPVVEQAAEDASPVVPPRTPPAEPPTIGRQSKVPPRGQRRTVDRDRDSVVQAAIRQGGITTQWKQDTTSDTVGNKNIPGVGALWSDKTGTSLDDMASLLDQHGYVPAGEMDKDGGVSWLQEAIRDELAGNPHYAPDSAKQIELAERELLNRYAEAVARAIDEREAEYARIEAEYGPDAAADARSFDQAMEEYTNQLEGAAADVRDQEHDTILDGEPLEAADASSRNDELRQADEREGRPAGAAVEAFDLQQQTEAGLAERARQQQEREKVEAEALRKSEQKAQADADLNDFTLTGSDQPADVGAARGQNDLFGAQPAPKQAEVPVAQQDPAAAALYPDQGALVEEAEPERPKRRAKPAAEKIDDTGDSLYWNRKNPWRGGGLKWEQIAGENEALRAKLVTKARVWAKPDWQSYLDELLPKLPEQQRDAAVLVARLTKQVYDALPAAPKDRSDKGLQAYIEVVERVRGAAEALLQDGERHVALLNGLTRRSGDILSFTRQVGTMPIFDAVFPEIAAGGRFQRGTPANDRGQLIGNKAIKAMQWSVADAGKALKDIKAGWPASQEAWQKQGMRVLARDALRAKGVEQFRSTWAAVIVDGVSFAGFSSPVRESDGSLRKFATQAEAESAAQAELQNWAPFLLLDKRNRLVGGFDSEELAIEAARASVKREVKPTVRETPLADAEIQRAGSERRLAGQNVTADQLRETFGLRGVNFGKYVPQGERQSHLNRAFDAMHDLAEVLGVPPRAMSLNGMLGLAFGAQGNGGKAAAHFVPGVNEINLTRNAGAGSLAHEWAHALDHYFGVQGGMASKEKPYASHIGPRGAAGELRSEIRTAIVNIGAATRSMEETEEQVRQRAAERVEQARQRQAAYLERNQVAEKVAGNAEAEAALARIVAGEQSEYVELPSRKRAKDYVPVDVKAVADAIGFDAAQTVDMHDTVSSLGYALKDQRENFQKRLVHTSFYKSSQALDGKGKAYWSTPHEMFARSFEAFVLDRLMERGAQNDYLVSPVKRDQGATDPGYPYPAGLERAAINRAFDTLIGAIETRETEAGVGLYRLGDGAGVSATEVAAALAASPELSGIQVVQSFEELPLAARIRAERDGLAPGDMRGVFRPDGQYLVADNLDSLEDAVHTAVHEMVGHLGVRGVLGSELNATLERIYSSEASTANGRQRIAQIREAYAEPLKRRSPAGQRQFVAEEIVAHLAESGDRPGVLQRFVSKVRAVLRRLFPQVRWTYNDILGLIEQSRKWLQRERTATGRKDGVLYSLSAMKSVGANIRRGREALAEAVTGKTSVHRAMYRSGLGWVDFVWGSAGRVKASGKTAGAMGLAHIFEARQRKDGASQADVTALLDEIVGTIAKGREFSRTEFGPSTRVGIEHADTIAWLTKREGSNAWVVTGYEKSPGGRSAGRATESPTHSAASRTRDAEGAGLADNVADESSSLYSLRLAEQAPGAVIPSQSQLSTSATQEEAGLELPAESVPRRLQRQWQDKLNRFTVLREWLAERGVELSEQADVYKAEERMHSRFANKAKDFREGTVQPLVEKIQKAGFGMDEVSQFLHAQHAQERNAQVAKINKQMPDGGSGMSNAEAQAILAAADPKLVRLANEFRAITDRTRQVLLDSGLINKEMAGAWQKAYQHYVPLKGGPDGQAAQAGTGKGLSAKHKNKRALGHQVREEGEWIVENIIADHERALMAAEKNLVGRHLLKMAMDVGMDEIMTVGKPEKRGVLQSRTSYEVLYQGRSIGAFETLEGARTFKAAAPLTMKNATLSDFTLRQSNDPSVVYMASPTPAPNEALVYVDGNVIRIQINDDLLARAYNNLGADAIGTFLSVGRALNRWFSTVYTGYNPEFLVTNIIRDFTTGLANVTGEEGALFAAKTAKNYFASFGALLRYARKGTADPWIRQYREDGGNTGAAYLSDLERLGADVQTEYAAYQGVLANLRKGRLKGAARAAGRRAFNVTLRHIEALNEAGENAMRLALYRTAVEQGMTRNKAASLAKNTTVNFNRKGELGAQANALYLFFNASVQGTASLAHAHFKGQHKRQAWALSGAMAALGYSLALLAAGGDEDEYEKTPDHVKARNLVIPLGDGQSLTIPIPYGYGFFFNVGRLAADAQRTGQTDGMGWKLAASFVGEFTPFGGSVAGDEPELAQAGIFLMPTVAQIPLSVAFNRTSFGGPMYPENSFKQFEPDRLKMWRGTEGTWADSLAGALESVGMDVSPENLKYLSRTFTGGAGNFVGSTVDAVALGAQGAAPEAREVPFLRKFYRENGVGDARARFWRYQAKAKKAAEEFERAIDAGDRSRVQALVGESRELISMAEVAQAFSEASGAVRDRVQEVRLGDLPVAEQREQIRRIEQRETELYDRFIGIFKARVQAQ